MGVHGEKVLWGPHAVKARVLGNALCLGAGAMCSIKKMLYSQPVVSFEKDEAWLGLKLSGL